jgi:Rps23 Pro-64 3,4-dihydroxylase Tpa1-like proline 4-hydroxylase
MIDLTLSKKLKSQYSLGYPFPHTVIDGFLHELLIDKSLEELTKYEHWGHDSGPGRHQVNKFFTPWCTENVKEIEKFAPITKFILDYLNSKEVLNFLEELTGIQNLIPDNTWNGGGVHKINTGGKLSVHSDYSIHPETKLFRRINLLIYLNKDWVNDWGGSLQLWEKDMSKCVKDILPVFNRAVIFNTTQDALHGHPHPLNSPEGISRYSYALYYFTKENPNIKNFIPTTHALWKELPTKDSSIFKF